MSTYGDVSPLLAPTALGAIPLANGVVMAPMTRSRAEAANVPGPLTVEYYRQRASAGLLITEGAQISAEGVGYTGTPGIHTEEQVAGWRRVTDAVHERGGRIVLQLWHVGRISHPSLQPGGALPVAPSALRPEGGVYTASGMQPFVTPRALETAEIPRIVADFAAGARRAIAAGFDGVEIHGANGYLIDQFLRSGSNHRTDAYGGSVVNRVRFLVEVATAVAGAVGADRTGVRLSPFNPFNSMSDADPAETFTAAARALAHLRLAFLEIVEPAGAAEQAGLPGPLSPALKAAFGGPYVLNGGLTPESAAQAIREGWADAVSFGAPYIANPDLVERIRDGVALATPDRRTFYMGGAQGYVDYPTRDEIGAAA